MVEVVCSQPDPLAEIVARIVVARRSGNGDEANRLLRKMLRLVSDAVGPSCYVGGAEHIDLDGNVRIEFRVEGRKQ